MEILKPMSKEFLDKYIFPVFIGNLDKFIVLKTNYNRDFEGEFELVDYKINIQTTLCHVNMGSLDDDYRVLLQLIFKNNRKKIYEINQTDLIKFIEVLQEIYGKIKV